MIKPTQRFVLLRHVISDNRHWDLMLEKGNHLATWRLLTHPSSLASAGPTDQLPAERIADHRLAYLTYEGPVSGGRGEVTREDAGEYEVCHESTDVWRVRLTGNRLNGLFDLPIATGKGYVRRASPVSDSGESPTAPT
ncbi:MAG: hypothetical protein KA354_15815 [Phycisphaerae bacterium]|nr:hypothetical protein [Phycisphaerae bacterium]